MPSIAALAALPARANPAPRRAPQPSAVPISSAAARACGALPRFNAATADEILAGRLTIAPFPAVTIDPHRDGDVNWNLTPFGNPT